MWPAPSFRTLPAVQLLRSPIQPVPEPRQPRAWSSTAHRLALAAPAALALASLQQHRVAVAAQTETTVVALQGKALALELQCLVYIHR
ncbi:unnamed protein product [Symbiodinium pilosum]|uniref:Uncharacterized protein n=1 Tax=Symbiodinium pilosum TaxID=2952 RepID=A0A812WV50_SYMPI|nr:unnamed protein product [Symbiodinium pilosum]